MAWVGVRPKVVRMLMLHAPNTLTVDNYGHLFSGQQADAAARLHVEAMLNPEPTRRPATGAETATIPA